MGSMTQRLRPRLLALASRARLTAVARQLAAALGAVGGAIFTLVLLDGVAPLPAGVRLAALVCLAVLAGLLSWRVARATRAICPEAIARRIELLTGRSDNAVINACQFEQQQALGTLPASATVWLSPTADLATQAVAQAPVAPLLALGPTLRLIAAALAVAALASVGWRLWPDHAAHGLARLALPLADLPPLGAAVVAVDPQALTVVRDGATVLVRVQARPANGRGVALPAPELRVADGLEPLAAESDAGRALALTGAGPGLWRGALPDLHRALTLRAWCAGTATPALRVEVLPPPRLTTSRFTVDGPAYTGIHAEVRPGPPAAATVLPGAALTLALATDQQLTAVRWILPEGAVDLIAKDGVWGGSAKPQQAGPYSIVVPASAGIAEQVLVRGELRIEADHPPEATLGGDDRNRFVDPGQQLTLPVTGGDDHGLADLVVQVREASEGSAPQPVQAWTYLGPPGPKEAAETLRLTLDPARYRPGRAYVFTAQARDRLPPQGQVGTSAPLVLRLRAVADLTLPSGDPRSAAFELLRRCIGEQTKARASAGNLLANLAEVRLHHAFSAQTEAAAKSQDAALIAGTRTVEAFAKIREATVLALLKPLVDPAMVQLRDGFTALTDTPQTAEQLTSATVRQDDLIARLTALLGSIAADARAKPPAPAVAGTPQQEADRHRGEELKKDLERFLDDQKRILERSRTLADRGGADLTADEDKIAGELSRSEKEWAKMLDEKLTDFAKNPPQDFSDASLATETNAVWQDVKLAADALDGKKIELAVPREQSGLENAEKLVNNLEKWLMDSPDKIKWEMEDAPASADVPLAELPKELEDIVGDLLDKAEEMTPDVQDASSAWMDSIDKGAGWGTGDGPISNMSAKGVTGNVLPNANEVGGRSGEGRNGRSNGQMVQDSAVGKGGQETPTRLSNTPFEQGSVKDSSKESGGGASGGGKLSGFDAEGLRGPAPPPQLKQAMARLAGKQQELRQKAEVVATGLRARRMPSGAVESAVAALDEAAEAAKRFDAPRLRQVHARILDDLGAARRDLADASSVRRDRSTLGERARAAAAAGADEPVPAGYEDMAGRYFQALAGAK
jgi:hypothetical protein